MYIRPFYFLSLHCKSTGDALIPLFTPFSPLFYSIKTKKVSPEPQGIRGDSKGGGDLLSRIALQYHRRGQA